MNMIKQKLDIFTDWILVSDFRMGCLFLLLIIAGGLIDGI